jgi:hypothetical protein
MQDKQFGIVSKQMIFFGQMVRRYILLHDVLKLQAELQYRMAMG